MKRPIKFRGRDIETGEQIIYGTGYAELFGKIYIFDAEFGMAYHVAPDSVAQLVGYDEDGREVYEGDWLVLKNGTEYQARLFDNGIDTAKLKENEQ